MNQRSLATLSLLAAAVIITSCSAPQEPTPATPGKDWRVTWDPGKWTNLTAVIHVNGRFMALSSLSDIYTSRDGITWRETATANLDPSNGFYRFYDIAWTGDHYLVCGMGGALFYSWDAQDWTLTPTGTTESIHSLVVGPQETLALTASGATRRSRNGKDWEPVTGLPDNAGVSAGIFHGGVYYLFAEGQVFTSQDLDNWTAHTAPIPREIRGVASSPTALVVVSYQGVIATSLDGKTWSAQSVGADWKAVTWTGSHFIATGYDTYALSEDGVTWQVHDLSLPQSPNDLVSDGERTVAVGNFGEVATFDEGPSSGWVLCRLPASAAPREVVWDGTQFVVVGNYGIVLRSHDGSHWDPPAFVMPGTGYQIIWDGESYFVSSDSGKVFYSNDAITWYTAQTPVTQNLFAIATDGNIYVCASQLGTILRSTDGLSWDIVSQRPGALYAEVEHTAIGWFVTGVNGEYGFSPDGVDWRFVNTGLDDDLIAVASSDSVVLIAGVRGAMITTTNGIDWTFRRQFYGHGFAVLDALWAEGVYYIVGARGLIVTTSDFEEWVNHYPPRAEGIRGIAHNGERFVAVAATPSLIITSP